MEREDGRQRRASPDTEVKPLLAAGNGRLSERVADAIVNLISQGHYQPGDRLVEEEIGTRLSVSRVPIREAINTLETQGILVLSLNRGARVAAFGERERQQVNRTRIALERLAAQDAIAAYRVQPQQLERLEEVIFRMELVARRDDWVAMRDCDVMFHRELCAASGNAIIQTLWEALSRHISIIFGREISTERDYGVVIAQHRRLYEVLRDGGDSDAEIEAHIRRLG